MPPGDTEHSDIYNDFFKKSSIEDGDYVEANADGEINTVNGVTNISGGKWLRGDITNTNPDGTYNVTYENTTMGSGVIPLERLRIPANKRHCYTRDRLNKHQQSLLNTTRNMGGVNVSFSLNQGEKNIVDYDGLLARSLVDINLILRNRVLKKTKLD